MFECDYYVPWLAHAAMEPLVALADFKDGRVTVWAPTQNPQAVQAIVAANLLWPNPGFKIALHSPKTLIETGLRMCPPEKRRDGDTFADKQSVLCSPV